MAGHYVPSLVLTGMAELVETLGGNAEALRQEMGWPADVFVRPDLPLDFGSAVEGMHRAAKACHCRNFGLLMASRSNFAIAGQIWVLLRSAGTVQQLVDDLTANYVLFSPAAPVSAEPAGDGVLLRWDPVATMAEDSTQAVEFAFALGMQELRAHLPSSLKPPSVMFRHAEPSDTTAHRKIFGPDVSFNRDRNAMYLDRATLAAPLNLGGSRTRTVTRTVLRLDGQTVNPGVGTRVENIVRALMPYAPCTLEDVGRAMGMSTRALQAHLNAQGKSFKGIKDAVRADLALHYLRNSTISLSEIAEILGYSELSAFSRSFRRWHGVPAQTVRNQATRGSGS